MYVLLVMLSFLLHPADPSLPAASETRAVSVSFENFETVFRITSSLLAGPSGDDSTRFMQEPFGYLLFGLDRVDKQVRTAILADSRVVLLGTKDYRPPNGLGRVLSTRCYIAVLREGSSFELFRHFSVPPVASSASSPVWSWSAEMSEFGDRETRPSSLYATQVAHTYVLVSNNLAELQKLSEALNSSHSSRYPTDIREWDNVRRHEFWGYRQYKPDDARASTLFNGLTKIRSGDKGLILYVDQKHRIGILRLLGSESQVMKGRDVGPTGRIAPLKHVGRGQWETVFPLGEVGPFPESAYEVMWLFGLGVVV